jgi:hypothetical protein
MAKARALITSLDSHASNIEIDALISLMQKVAGGTQCR